MYWDAYIGVEGIRKRGQMLEAIVLVRNYGEWNRPVAVKKEEGGSERFWEDINLSSFRGKYIMIIYMLQGAQEREIF